MNRWWARSRSRLAVAAFGSMLQGCAFAEMKVKLDPSPTVASAEGAEREVVVFPAVDQRANARVCGARRDGSGAEMGRVSCASDPAQWLNEAMLHGLHRRNFRVVTLPAASSPAPLQVNLILKTLFIDQVHESDGVWLLADVEVHVTVHTANGLLAERSFFVRQRRAAPTDDSYQATLTLATRRIANDILDAVGDLANAHPAIGRVDSPAAMARRL